MRNTFQFNLPKGFHGIKEFDISFAESDEFYLDEYTGVYTSEYEYTNRNDDEFLIQGRFTKHLPPSLLPEWAGNRIIKTKRKLPIVDGAEQGRLQSA